MKIRQAVQTRELRLGDAKDTCAIVLQPVPGSIDDEAFASIDYGSVTLHIKHPDAMRELRVGQRWRIVLEPIQDDA